MELVGVKGFGLFIFWIGGGHHSECIQNQGYLKTRLDRVQGNCLLTTYSESIIIIG